MTATDDAPAGAVTLTLEARDPAALVAEGNYRDTSAIDKHLVASMREHAKI
jgi:hypothetical protein